MDKYNPSTAGKRSNNDDSGSYKVVPTMDTEKQTDVPRKRNSRKFDDMEETPFTDFHRPSIKPQGTNAPSYKKDSPTCAQNTGCYFCNFCDNTSIHGFKFLGEQGRFMLEKVWWFLVVCGAITGSGSLIYKTYNKWVTSPVMVTFAMTETPIWNIPFPAVTICPELKINRTMFNFTDVYMKYSLLHNTTEEEDEYFDLFGLVCLAYDDVNEKNGTKYLSSDSIDKFFGAFADMNAIRCKWLGTDYSCDDMLSDWLTSEGWCRTFNILNFDEIYVETENYYENRTNDNATAQKWSLEDGYPSTDDLDTFPRRTIVSGTRGGFEIQLLVDDDDIDYLCSDLQGFKVTLHHPAEEPDMDKHFRLPLNEAVVVGIRPRMITTSAEIENYEPEDRMCYLPQEKILSTYKIYSQQNCMSECLTNYTLKTCGCIPFYTAYNGDPEFCGTEMMQCMENAKVSFLTKDATVKVKNFKSGSVDHCGCLPSCTALEFDSETSQTEWNWRKLVKLEDHDFSSSGSAYDTVHCSKLIVYYKDMQFMTSERHELYGTIDFLANCGGLLGLFCGFSFTSGIEILYYLTLRLACNIKKYGKRFWSGAPELM